MRNALLFVGVMAGVLAACGGGGGGGETPAGDTPAGGETSPSLLAGTWEGFGEVVTQPGSFNGTTTFDDAGNITEILIDGVSSGNTAELLAVAGDYHFLVDEADDLVVVRLDASGSHMAIADDFGRIAVMQDAASVSASPGIAIGDLFGRWEGEQFAFNSAGDLASGSMIITVNFTASDVATFSYGGTVDGNTCGGIGNVSVLNASDNAFGGDFTFSTGEPANCVDGGVLRGYMSPDKQHVAIVSCPAFTAANIPQACAYMGLNRTEEGFQGFD